MLIDDISIVNSNSNSNSTGTSDNIWKMVESEAKSLLEKTNNINIQSKPIVQHNNENNSDNWKNNEESDSNSGAGSSGGISSSTGQYSSQVALEQR